MNNTDVVGEITITHKITKQFIDDVMCTAFDGRVGGVYYWCIGYEIITPNFVEEWTQDNFKEYWGVDYKHDALSCGAWLKVDVEDDEPRILTKEGFMRGLQMFIDMRAKQGRAIQMDGDELDAGDIDAEDADVIVQYAIFGEIVYG